MANVELHAISPSTGRVTRVQYNLDNAEYRDITAALPTSVSGNAQVIWREQPLGFRSARVLESGKNIEALVLLIQAAVYQGQSSIIESELELVTNNDLNLSVAGQGHTIASTTILSSYYSSIATATGTTADAIRLADVANNTVQVVKNSTAVQILVFPFANTGTIVGTGLATAAPFLLDPGKKVSFYTTKDALDSTSANYRNYYVLT